MGASVVLWEPGGEVEKSAIPTEETAKLQGREGAPKSTSAPQILNVLEVSRAETWQMRCAPCVCGSRAHRISLKHCPERSSRKIIRFSKRTAFWRHAKTRRRIASIIGIDRLQREQYQSARDLPLLHCMTQTMVMNWVATKFVFALPLAYHLPLPKLKPVPSPLRGTATGRGSTIPRFVVAFPSSL